MTRKVAENTNSISVFFLKTHGYLPQVTSRKYGGVNWISEHKENTINFWVNIEEHGGFVELAYTYSNYETSEQADMRYHIQFTTTPCQYRGRRYWFICPLSSHGIRCEKRVAVLYSVGKWFGCRYCANIAYRAQFYSEGISTGFVSDASIERAHREVKQEYYNGKPTRKYKRYLRLSRKLDNWKKKAAIYGIEF